MTEELSIEGKQYISSKRAADLSGYAQDYVGQLARKGLIDAQRIGGLWYVFMDSLQQYKAKAEAYVPVPPQATFKNDSPDTLISFDGKDYISAARASEITGYHQDYVGQLARSGKILSRQVGNRWYVHREGILDHKQEKDDLLGAVQAQSVGIKPLQIKETSYERKIEAWEPLNYITDSSDLIPTLAGRQEPVVEDENDVEEVPIPIKKEPVPPRIIENRQIDRIFSEKIEKKSSSKVSKKPRKTIIYATLGGAIVCLVLVFVYRQFVIPSALVDQVMLAGSSAINGDSTSNPLYAALSKIGDLLEPLVSKDIHYIRD